MFLAQLGSQTQVQQRKSEEQQQRKSSQLLGAYTQVRHKLKSVPAIGVDANELPTFFQNSLPTWLPHWPTWMLMISLGMVLIQLLL